MNDPAARLSEQLPEGKILPRVLRKVLRRLGGGAGLDPGPASGEDAAVAAAGSEPRLVLAADPITFPSADPGWHAVIVNANDVAATGGEPRWFLSSILVPPGTDAARVVRIADGIRRGCREIGAIPAGGHTEVTAAVRHELVAGAMIGMASLEHVKPSGGAREGDLLVITKGIAIEATAIIASEFAEDVRGRFGAEFQAQSARFLRDPGISVVPEARIAARAPGVHAMHDVTEGGVATAIREMVEAAGLGAVVEETRIPHFDESRRLMRHYGLDILGAIGSGALLIACSEAGTGGLLRRLQDAGIAGRVIGRFVAPARGIVLDRGASRRELPRFEADEITRLP
ncbi:MAG: hydrogenase expression protein [Gammaproteobacteria bacterium]|nr:hydrogenase expression protein [Gammaproteobacteria bacterium]MYC51183.1 hydrogenase expression protein [Gammaproteobacteria bacterium]